MFKIKRFNESNSNKVLLIHGLGGSPSEEKSKVFRDLGYEVVFPFIDYDMEWEKDKFKSKFIEILNLANDCDLIVGQSIGGYLAYLLNKATNIETIIINPALDRTKTKLNIKNFDVNFKNINNGTLSVYIGSDDILVLPIYTLDYIKDNNINAYVEIVEGMEHRVSPKFLNTIMDNYFKRKSK